MKQHERKWLDEIIEILNASRRVHITAERLNKTTVRIECCECSTEIVIENPRENGIVVCPTCDEWYQAMLCGIESNKYVFGWVLRSDMIAELKELSPSTCAEMLG